MSSPFAQGFQAEIRVLEPGKAEARLPVQGEFLQGRGVEVVTVELRLSYIRPVREGLLQAQAQVVHAGGRLFHATGEVLWEETRVALAKGIFYRVA